MTQIFRDYMFGTFGFIFPLFSALLYKFYYIFVTKLVQRIFKV